MSPPPDPAGEEGTPITGGSANAAVARSPRRLRPGLMPSLMAAGAIFAAVAVALRTDHARIVAAALVMLALVTAAVVGLLGLTRLLERWAG